MHTALVGTLCFISCSWPGSLQLAAGATLLLQVRVHLVDAATRLLVQAFIVAAEAGPPNISRRFQVCKAAP